MKRINTLVALILTAAVAGLSAQDVTESQQVSEVTDHWSPYEYPTVFPPGAKVYIIVSGDTLWDIAESTYNNPLIWPQIYAANSYIGNPHWIYPGDPLVMPDLAIAEAGRIIEPIPEETTPSEEEQPVEEAEAEEQAIPTPSEEVPLGERGVFAIEPRPSREFGTVATDMDLYCSSVVFSSIPETDFWVAGTEESDQVEATQYDIVYLNQGRDRISAGDQFVALLKVGQILNPHTDIRVGYAYQEVGILEVIIAAEKHSVAEIIHACDGLAPGAILLPYTPRPNPVARVRQTMLTPEQYQPLEDKLRDNPVGTIVYANNQGQEISATEIVNIDLGSSDELKIGDRCLVFSERGMRRTHDDYKSASKSVNENAIVRRVLGEIIILRVLEHTAAAKVTYNVDFINIGDRVVAVEPLTAKEASQTR